MIEHLGETHIARLRRLIEAQYVQRPTGCGNSFDEILCWEIHENGMTFIWLAEKWSISLPTLGEIIRDHCCKLEDDPVVCHNKKDDKAT
ncbi:hypothetical protein LCGC14_2783800 [marine sediment metagenome]|uniref:Uncharacterized protein n=1 Tax=marine sediment metagenome TaxID=412755 RepID=A0A0F8YSK3_9ZZZZ